MQMKRIAAPRHYTIKRKVKKFTVFPKGPHKQTDGLALSIVIRDILNLVDTRKEVKKILNEGLILVDGKKRKDNYCVGFMDVVSIPSTKKYYRVSVDKRGLNLKEINKNEENLKLARVKTIKNIKGGKYQLCLHDGKCIITDKKYAPYTSLLIAVPDLEVKKSFDFGTGALAIVFKGSHRGKVGKITKVEKDRVMLKGDEEFITSKKYVYVVGKEKEEIEL